MGNPLQSQNPAPAAPLPEPGANSTPMQRQMAQGPQAPSLQQPMQIPAPSNAETIAALRHLGAVERELETLLRDPNLGRSDMKDTIISGMTRLVSQRMFAPNEAVTALADVPRDPFHQREWALQHFMQTIQAQRMVLDHHRAAHSGVAEQHPGNPDEHLSTLKGMLTTHYNRGNANGQRGQR